MKKILITGASGMVGRNLVEFLNMKNYTLLTPSSKELNLLNKNQIDLYLSNNKPDIVIHCAGKVGGIQANMTSPVSFLVDNMQMGLNIIMASFEKEIKNFINLSSSCMYPKNALNPLSEELILKGELEPTNEGYALAKVTTTRLCEYINQEDNSYQYKTIIPCNLYGKYDKFDLTVSHMIPAVINKIHNAKINNQNRLEIWGDGGARREFMYAEDLADFIYYAIEKFSLMPQNINVGLGYDYTINEYYQIIAEVINYKGQFVYDLTKPVGMKQKLVDTTKLSNFGWNHKTSLRDGIQKTYQYYLNEMKNDK